MTATSRGRRPSIRARLTWRLLGGVGLLLVCALGGIYFAMGAALLGQFDDTLVAKSEALVTASEIDEEGFEIDLVVQDFADFGPLGSDHFEMMHPDGTVFARSPSLGATSLGVLPELDWDRVDIRTHRLPDGRRVRLCARSFQPKDDVIGAWAGSRLVVAMPLAPLDRALRLLAIVLAAVGGACLLVMVPLVGRALAAGLRPLTAFNAQLRAWDGSPESWRLERGQVPSELEPMVVALEGSLARVAATVERERRFSANAAHELRTPIAEIRALAELVARWPEDGSAERAEEIVAASDRMARLLGQLAELARSEQGGALEPAPLDVGAEVKDIVARHADEAARRGLRLSTRIADATVVADASLWRSVVENLVSNAVAHAPEGAEVHVTASARAFEVRNPAPTLVAGDVDRMFERFWRPAGAGHSDRHSGLGLSIVAAHAARLGATVAARLEDGELEIRVEWGAQEPSAG